MPLTRVALVGTGYIADFHAKAIRAVPGVELAGVCDKSEQYRTDLCGEVASAVYLHFAWIAMLESGVAG